MTAALRASADLDPSTLSTQQKRALRVLAVHRLFRRAGGYGRPPYTVSLDVAASLVGLKFARKDLTGHGHELVLTYAGKLAHAVLEQRAQRRKA